MLNANDLSSKLLNAMQQANTPSLAHTRFANALASYLNDNLEVTGIYNGVLPNGSPDPANGNYKWKPLNIVVPSASLQSGAASGMQGWLNAMKLAFNTITISGNDKTSQIITTAPSMLLIVNLSVDMSSKPTTMDAAFNVIGGALVNGLKGATFTPITVPANSVQGGTGTVTFTAVE